MEKAFVVHHVKGWRFLAVERAEPDVFAPAPNQPDPAPD
jgi:hypothetical protein